MHIQQHSFPHTPCILARASRLPGPCPAAPGVIPVAARDTLTAANRNKMRTSCCDVISEGLEGSFVDCPPECILRPGSLSSRRVCFLPLDVTNHCEVVTDLKISDGVLQRIKCSYFTHSRLCLVANVYRYRERPAHMSYVKL